jgi:hypothetical protein
MNSPIGPSKLQEVAQALGHAGVKTWIVSKNEAVFGFGLAESYPGFPYVLISFDILAIPEEKKKVEAALSNIGGCLISYDPISLEWDGQILNVTYYEKTNMSLPGAMRVYFPGAANG